MSKAAASVSFSADEQCPVAKCRCLNRSSQRSVDAHYLAGDVAKPDELRRIITEIRSRFGKLDGIVHAAGITRDRLILNTPNDDLEQVLSAKVAGTILLDELTADQELDFAIGISSLAAVAGNTGQANYSAANAFLDAYMSRRIRTRPASYGA